jgi:histone-lysine N-methyltransferase SETMAR
LFEQIKFVYVATRHFEMDLDRVRLRVIVYYCWKRHMSPPDIFKEVNATLGNGSISLRTCQNLVNKFSSGDFEMNDATHSGRPPMDIDGRLQELLDENPHHSVRSLAQEIGVSAHAVHEHLRGMGKKYLTTCWIPHRLSEENKAARVRACEELLLMHRHSQFLHQLVTMDETWIYWDMENTGHQRKAWHGDGDQPVVAVKARGPTNRKHMLSIFWDCHGVLLMEVLPEGETVTADYYCLLLDRLITAIQMKRRRSSSSANWSMRYQHDNARPHVARKTVEKLNELRFIVLPHPPYSPDLAPSDFYLFSPLKSALRGKTYASKEDIQADIEAWIASKPREFFDAAFTKLPGRWQKCIDHAGDYFEHLSDTEPQ